MNSEILGIILMFFITVALALPLGKYIAKTIVEVAEREEITTICISKLHITLFGIILNISLFNPPVKKMSVLNIDLVILS